MANTMRFDDFYANVRTKYPTVSLAEVREAYKSAFDRDPVFETAPPRDQFRRNVATQYPEFTDDEIDDQYNSIYGDSLTSEAKRSTQRGLGGMAGLVGSGLQLLQDELPDVARTLPIIGPFKQAADAVIPGERVRDYWKEQIATVPRSAASQGDVQKDPMGTLGNPSWWAAGAPEMIANQAATIGAFMLGGPAGAGLVGGGMEGLQTYGEAREKGLEQPGLRGIGQGMASGALNAIPFAGGLGRGLGGLLARGTAEGVTEGLEELPGTYLESPVSAWDDPKTLDTAINRGINIAPLAAVAGGLNPLGFPSQNAPSNQFADVANDLRSPQAPEAPEIPTTFKPYTGETKTTLPKAEVHRQGLISALEPIVGRWKNGPKVHYVQAFRDLPDEIKARFDDSINGAYDGNDNVYLVADKFTSPAEAAKVLYHESLGHYGIEQIVPDIADFAAQVEQFAPNDPVLSKYWEGAQRDYANDEPLIRSLETVARYAEDFPNTKHPLVERIYARLREFGRNTLGINIGMNRADLNRLLRKAVTHLEQGTNGPTGSNQTGEMKAQRVWHGSPHRFDKFDLSKMGTGEGAQVYGAGHYFAEQKEIAEYYRDELSKKKRDWSFFVDGKEYVRGSPEFVAADMAHLAQEYGPVDKDWLDNELGVRGVDDPKKVRSLFRKFQKQKIERRSGGQLYEAEIPDDGAYLLWDKQVDVHGPAVEEAVKKAIDSMPDATFESRNQMAELLALLEISREDSSLGEWPRDIAESMLEMDIESARGVIQRASLKRHVVGEDVYKALANAFSEEVSGETDASRALKAAGIPGIKYLDGSSRDQGEGKHNYVIFDDSDVEIKAKASRPRGGTETVGEFTVKQAKDGSLFVSGAAEQIRSAIPEDIKGRPVDGGIQFTGSAAPRVRAALEGRNVAYSRGGRVLAQKPIKNGKYVGAPAAYDTHGKIPHLRKWLRKLSDEGAPGRFWYENSSREILRMTGGDVNEARRFVALLAIYSPQAKVDGNTTCALRAWAQYKAGQPIKVKTGVQDAKAAQALADVDAFWKGEKTGNFITNLLRMIDPATADKQGATIDMWMMRAGRYANDAPTATQYAFMEDETNRLAADLGWEPQQVQAAIWVAMKARMENKGVKERTEASSEKAGWVNFTRDAKGKKVRNVVDAQAHRDNWLRHAFEHDPTTLDTSTAKFDFSDGVLRHIGQMSFEARPGRTSGVLPGIHTASWEKQQDFHAAVRSAMLDENGVDVLAQKLGLLVDAAVDSPGVWQGEVSPSTQTRMAMAPNSGVEDAKSDGKSKSVDPAQRQALDAYAAIVGALARQEAVGWHRPFYQQTRARSNGLDISIGRVLSPSETIAAERAVDTWMREQGHDNWGSSFAIITTPTGIRLINFGVISNNELQESVAQAVAGVLPDAKAQWFQSDGNLVENSWENNPDGQAYIDRASASGRPDVLGWVRDVLAPKVQSVFESFSESEGWGEPGDARKLAWPKETSGPKASRSVTPFEQPTFEERARQSIVRETEFSPQILDAYVALAQGQEGRIEQQRRGVQSWDQTAQKAAAILASDMGYEHVASLVSAAPGTAANPEALVIMAGAVHEAIQRVESAALEVTKDRSPANLARMKATMDRLAFLQGPWMGFRAEAGRALNILRKTAPIAQNVNDLLDRYVHNENDIIGMAERVVRGKTQADAGEARNETGKMIREQYTPTIGDKFLEYYYNSILSGPATHGANIMGNSAFMVTEEIAKQIGLWSTGQGRAAMARLGGISLGIQTGMLNAKNAFATELPQLDQQTKMEVDPALRAAIPGRLGKVIRTPGRALQAEDEFFKGIAYTMELAQLASQAAQGDQVKAREIMANPTPEMMKQAVLAARRVTFTNKVGPAAQSLMRFTQKVKPAKLIIPFIQTPVNITKRAMDYSPFGLLGLPFDTEIGNDLKGKNGKEKQAIAVTRQMMGAGLSLMLWQLAAAGLVTGGGPADPEERTLWRQRDGRDSYSAKIGDQWVSYLRFDPLAIPMGLMADLYETVGLLGEKDAGDIGISIMNSLVNNLANKTWLSGVSSFAQAINDPPRYGESFMGMVATGVAVPNIIGQTTNFNDPWVRQSRGILDRIRSRIPGERDELAKRVGISGEDMKNNGVTLAGVPMPFRASDATEVDQLADTMLRLGVIKKAPSMNFMGVELEPQEHTDWQKTIQQQRWKTLTPIVNSPGFKAMPPIQQATMLEEMWDKLGSSKVTRAQFLMQHPEVLDRVKARVIANAG